MGNKSLGIVFGIMLLVVGLIMLLFSPGFGLVIIIVGLIMSFVSFKSYFKKEPVSKKKTIIIHSADLSNIGYYEPQSKSGTQVKYVTPSVQSLTIYKNASLKSIANFIVLDVETTGFNNSDRVIEIGMIRYRDHKPVDQYQTLINPGMRIPTAASRVNHITDSMVADSPKMEDVASQIVDFIGDDPIVGHNISFDIRLLYVSGCEIYLEDRKIYDTLKTARQCLETPNHKLETLCGHLQIERNQAHRSIGDCISTGILFQKLFEIKTGKQIPVE